MRMRKILSCLLALALALVLLAVPAMAALPDEGWAVEPEPVTGGAEPLTPEGNMTLVDDISGEAAGDKHFIVVQSRGGHYFYIIIDHAGEGENTVHFLNQVDESDLLALVGEGEQAPVVCSCTTKCKPGAVDTSCELCAANMTECVGAEPEPATTEEPDTPSDEPDAPEEPGETAEEKSGGKALMIVAVLVVLGVGGAVAYLKFFKKKPKAKGKAALNGYDYGDDGLDGDEPEEDDDGLDDEAEDE